MTLNGVMAVTLRYFTEFGKPALQKTIMAEFMQMSIVFSSSENFLFKSVYDIDIDIVCTMSS